MTKRMPHIVVGVTGSIAAYKACELVRLFRKDGSAVTAVMTQEAMKFIAPLTLQTLSGNKVMTDLFEEPEEWNPAHVSLAKKANLVVIAPASANIIGKLACGIYDDMLTCTVAATEAPVLIAPAMNGVMYRQRAVQANIERLKKAGYIFVGPIKGTLACGDEATGHIADTADIVKEARKLLR